MLIHTFPLGVEAEMMLAEEDFDWAQLLLYYSPNHLEHHLVQASLLEVDN